MSDLHSRITSAVQARLAVAKAASQIPRGTTADGEHWHWECGECDTDIPITAVVLLDEFLTCPACDHYGVSLRSVEEYPTTSVGDLPHFVVYETEEMRPVDALYIAANDPAAVILQCERDLRVLRRHGPTGRTGRWCGHCYDAETGDVPWPCVEIVDLAVAYSISSTEEDQ